ncbi:hypothetical protein OQ482_19375 [Enterobacter bugandensis]|uniref:hypothetical protein n=1 Tax=Enterobacter bugandensis TaxID=881260 RepID=UPI00283A9F3E|nr:hypothetical protein [Enterobacter bugandensis]WMU42115.1 hypothetical protein OQ482_19375 [Enterobacter bugandensis]
MYDKTVKQFKGECPNCDNVIEYHAIKFPGINDKGEMIARCQSCKVIFGIQCKNPAESYIVSGADKMSSLDYEEDSPSSHKKLKESFTYKGDIFRNNPKFDFESYNLYKCPHCDDNLEKLAHENMSNDYQEWSKQIWQYIHMDISRHGYDAEKAIVKVNFSCSCRREHFALFYKNYNHCEFSSNDFLLGHISNCISFDNRIDGTITKSNFIELIKKLIIRWELIFEKTYLIFPYVGHTRSKSDELLDLWGEITSYSNPEKLKIITKTQTLNSYKNAVSEAILDYNILSKYKFTPQAIDYAIKNTRFHAKIYCGANESYVECLSGSANIAKGPTHEQLTFKKYDSYADFYEKFLEVFDTCKVADDVFKINENNTSQKCHVLFDKSEDYLYSQLERTSLIPLIKS